MERANPGEPLINVVTVDKPKMLTGLNQKVGGRCRGFCTSLPQTNGHRRTGGAHPHQVRVRNVVSPLLPRIGKATCKGS
jgi:hypothetical protein